jgi:beta-phosphoglucomutase
MRSAHAAGIKTVGIASTQDPAELYELGAVLVIPDFTDSKLWELLGSPNPND